MSVLALAQRTEVLGDKNHPRIAQANMLPYFDLSRAKRVLCLGAHCDDIEIGAGGTIRRLIESQPHLEVRWIVLAGEDPVRSQGS